MFDAATNGPCATPSSTKPTAEPFDDAHEDPNTCSNTVAVAGQCWLNGTVNYGTLGVMVRLCSDFALTDIRLAPVRGRITAIYNLEWAKMLVRAYKTFGQHPEAAALPILWTETTFHAGPRGVPKGGGNRPRCQCSCKCSADVARWDYIWEPFKSGDPEQRLRAVEYGHSFGSIAPR